MVPQSLFLNVVVGVGVFCALLGCLEFWYRLGNKARLHNDEDKDQQSTIQGATLGLLGLLLGFSFALAAGRYGNRVQLIIEEANVIDTAYAQADLLPTPSRDAVRVMLKEYTAQRILYYDAHDEATRMATMTRAETLQQSIWGQVLAEAKATPPLAGVLIPAANGLSDVYWKRVAASRRHLPAMLLGLLITCSVVAISSVGYGCGLAGKRNVVLTTSLTFVIAGTLWSILDMDHPRKGLIRAGQQPLIDLQMRLESSGAVNVDGQKK